MKLTLIIPTKNRKDDLTVCLTSVSNAVRKPNEIIIVDDGGDYDINEVLKNYNDLNIKVIKNEVSVGHAKARNQGIEISTGEIIFFLDDDCEVFPDYFQEIEKIYIEDKNEKVYGVEGIIVNENINNNKKNDFISELFMLYQTGPIGDIQLSGFSINSNEVNNVISTNILMGASSYRKKVYNEFKYNENFKGWSPDDIEFSYRVSRKYKLLRNPKAKMYHHHSQVEREKVGDYYSKRVWMHYVMWRRCVKFSFVNLLCYLWSEIGYLIYNILLSIKCRSFKNTVKIIAGIFYGYFLTFKMMIKDVF